MNEAEAAADAKANGLSFASPANHTTSQLSQPTNHRLSSPHRLTKQPGIGTRQSSIVGPSDLVYLEIDKYVTPPTPPPSALASLTLYRRVLATSV